MVFFCVESEDKYVRDQKTKFETISFFANAIVQFSPCMAHACFCLVTIADIMVLSRT